MGDSQVLNSAILMGRLTKDPELKHTTSNFAVTSFQLAVERKYAKPGTDRQADFITIVAWRAAAEFVCKYFKKGQMMAVDGSIQTRSYTDNQGNKRTTFEVVAEHIYFCGSKDSVPGAAAEKFTAPPPQDWQQGTDADLFTPVPGDDDLPF